MISLAFSSCLAMDFSRLEILKLVFAVSLWFDSRLLVALAIAWAVAAVAFVISKDCILALSLAAVTVCRVMSW